MISKLPLPTLHEQDVGKYLFRLVEQLNATVMVAVMGIEPLKILPDAEELRPAPPGWGKGMVLAFGSTDADRYYLALASDGTLYTGYSPAGGTIEWHEK